MLVLTRKLGEKIAIGNEIIVVVTEIRGTHVKLGIEAPPGVPVHRAEVLVKIMNENKKAADLHPEGLEDVLTRVIAQSRAPKQGEGEKQ